MHTHPNQDLTLTNTPHNHRVVCLFTSCDGVQPQHRHDGISLSNANAHTHAATIAFAAAALGSPNWWNHRHNITMVVCANGGGQHSHSWYPAGSRSYCSTCGSGNPHGHGCTSTAAGSVHSHIYQNMQTDTADPSGTPENHTHAYTIQTNISDIHNHNPISQPSPSVCGLGYSHSHEGWSQYSNDGHVHINSGTCPAGGEGAAVRLPYLDGFVVVA